MQKLYRCKVLFFKKNSLNLQFISMLVLTSIGNKLYTQMHVIFFLFFSAHMSYVQTKELVRFLCNIGSIVPKAIVMFLASYEYVNKFMMHGRLPAQFPRFLRRNIFSESQETVLISR
jgi:hypothetical protein